MNAGEVNRSGAADAEAQGLPSTNSGAADQPPMTHGEFVAAYRAGLVRVQVDRARAARFVSARMMLPFMMLPLLGGAVALALTGRLIAGIALFVAVLALRFLVRATSQGFVLFRALDRAQFYRDAVAAGALQVEPAGE